MNSVALRRPLLAAAALSLAGGLYAALALIDVPVPAAQVGSAHGPVMVFGFVGTLVALERAVASGARWALLAPLSSGLGAIALLAGSVVSGGGGLFLTGRILLCSAGVGLLATYAVLWRRRADLALLVQGAGAFCWYAATLLWLGGFPIAAGLPWLAGFVVLTIAGERLDLVKVGPSTMDGKATAWCAAVLVAATACVVWPGFGFHAYGLALLGLAVFLARFDVARRTVRSRGLPRYIAVGLLAGYAWLALAGLLWAGGGVTTDGPRYDATIHAVFLGFTLSMVFVHAPVILPAVLRRPLPYHPVLYGPLALLHVSLAVRLGAGDLAGLVTVWRWAGIANEVAVVGFLGCAAMLAIRAQTVHTRQTVGVAA
jgi:hypothetical protein